MQSLEVAGLVGALGVTELALANPTTPDPDASKLEFPLVASGEAQLYGAAVETVVTFAATAEALSVSLHGERTEHPPQLVDLDWASLDGLALDLSVTGPAAAAPVVSGALTGKIKVDGVP